MGTITASRVIQHPKKNPVVQIEETGLFCLRRMTVDVSHQECDSLVKRDRNSLSQSTQSRGLQMQKINNSSSGKSKAKNPNFLMEKVVKDR